MKKIYTLFILLLTLAIGAQADGTKGIKLTFSGATSTATTSDIKVSVTDLNGDDISSNVTASLSETSITKFQTQKACTGGNILAPAVDGGYDNGQNSTITYTFQINGLNSYIKHFNTINLGIVGLMSDGRYQPNNSPRTFNLTVKNSNSSETSNNFASLSDVDINSKGTSDYADNYISHTLSGSVTSVDDILYLNIVLTKTANQGCYAGLQDVEITIPTYTVTWNIKESESTEEAITSFTSDETEYGESATYTIPAYPFTTLTYNNTPYTSSFTAEKEVTESGLSENIIADFSSLPFTRSTTSDYHWYYLRDGANKDNTSAYWSRIHSLQNNTDKSPYFQKSAIGVLRSNYMWAFVGDPINGFQIVNCYYGTDKNLAPNAELSTFSSKTDAKLINLIPSETKQIWQIADGTTDTNGSTGGFGFYITYNDVPYYMNANYYQNELAIWNSFGKYSHWYVDTEVTTAYLDELKTYYKDVNSVYTDGTFGEGLGNYGYYVWTEDNTQKFSKDEVGSAVTAAKTYCESTTATASDQKAIDNAALGLYTYYYYFTTYGPNFPTAGTFLTISNGIYYVLASETAGDQTTALTSSTTASSNANAIWYYDGTGLRSYTSGYYLTLNSTLCNTSSTENTFGSSGNTGYTGYYNVKIGNTYYLSIDADNGTVSASTEGNTSNDATKLEEVTTLPIKLNKANSVTVTETDEETNKYEYFATICLPENYKISDGTRAFIVTGSETEGDNSYIVLTEVTGVIPAETAVILLSSSSSATATVNTDDTKTATDIDYTNYLTGVGEAKQITTDNYYFGKNSSGDPGFYRATSSVSKFITNKGYITDDDAKHLGATTSSSTASSNGFTFSFGNDNDPTGISSATGEGDAFDADAVRYNVQGQRVPQGYKGIVIINGKKYLIK